MKTLKVTYQTSTGLKFNTIVPFPWSPEDWFALRYDKVTILRIRPSVKQKYAHYVNKRIK
jgi:hypothetical protein